jgi:phage terminase large subunit GpA-like protein
MSLPTAIRVIDGDDPQRPGDVWKWEVAYIVCCPKCGKCSQTDHEVLTEADGTLTFSPSLICPHESCRAHYWIKAGKIQWS